MIEALLAIDVGGSTSRAYLVDKAGHCLGQGRNRGGNPASNTPEAAASAVISAVEAALADAGGGAFDIVVALIALAGPQAHLALTKLETGFRGVGLTGQIVFVGDLLAMFASVSLATEGYCVVAGTGAGAIRVHDGSIAKVVDLAGWLLGDLGSGYWLGHEAAKAVAADLENRGDSTALTPALLAALGIQWPDERQHTGRPLALRLFIDAIYALRPIELARFTPLVVAHRADPVASDLLAKAERFLIDDFAVAFDDSNRGPVALGGGVMPHLTGVPGGIAEILRAAGHEPDIRLVTDGSVGAIVLAMRAIGLTVDAAMFATIAASVAARASVLRVPVTVENGQ
jgi:N-acetylglucosamine kinase-like BadF-type ATPase